MNTAAAKDRGNWHLASTVLGAGLGMAVGFAAIFISTNGIFIPAVLHEFHWSRAHAAQSYAASMLGLALVSPLIGTLMDRFGIRRIIMVSVVGFAGVLMCMGFQNGNQYSWIALSLLVGVSGAATSVLGYLAILAQWFDRRLGLAIGFSMVGLGVGTIILPPISQLLITDYGWRHAYQILAVISIAGGSIACLLMRERSKGWLPERLSHRQDLKTQETTRGHRSTRILIIFFAALLSSSAALSLGPHLPALLIDRGVSPPDAARSASLVGMGILAGRLVSGYLVDRIHAPAVACLFFAAGAMGFVLLHRLETYPSALWASMLVGLSIGAEGDLLAYLVRTYIGLENFGLFYGIAFSGYALGAVIGPVAVGRYFDIHNSYALPLQMAPYILLTAGLLLLFLGRYSRHGTTPMRSPGEVQAS